MVRPRLWPAAERIETRRLTLEPLRVDHADEMAPVLADEELYEYIGGRPPTLEQLSDRFSRQVIGTSTDGTQGWLNWIVRHRETGAVLGTVQATIQQEIGGTAGELAWVIGIQHQRHGYAIEAAGGAARWLRDHGVDILIAHINPDHSASIGVARQLGMTATDVTVDGEVRFSI